MCCYGIFGIVLQVIGNGSLRPNGVIVEICAKSQLGQVLVSGICLLRAGIKVIDTGGIQAADFFIVNTPFFLCTDRIKKLFRSAETFLNIY